MEHWQKENVLIKHQEGYKNVRISKHETHVEIDTNTAPFIQAMFKEGAKDYLDSFKLKTKKGEDEDAK